MNEKIKQFIDTLQKTHLTEDEKFSVRYALLERMQQSQNQLKPVSIWHWFTALHKTAMIMTCLVIISLAGGTITAAAQNALPGDTLYAVKIGVNENVLRAIHSGSPRELVAFETEIMERRLVEAEDVSQKQDLTPSHATIIESGFSEQEKRVEKAVAGLVTEATISSDTASVPEPTAHTVNQTMQVTVQAQEGESSVHPTSQSKEKSKTMTSARVYSPTHDTEDTHTTLSSTTMKTSVEQKDKAQEVEKAVQDVTRILNRHKAIIQKIQSIHGHAVIEHNGEDDAQNSVHNTQTKEE